jgi:hypothetical protein
MSIAIARERLNPLEMGTLVVGFLLTGVAIAVTTVSYALNMTFQYQWLVWVITAAFGAVALITLAWPLAFRNLPGVVPEGRLRQLLLFSMPVAYILGSQVCGLGLASCGRPFRHTEANPLAPC